MSQAPHETFNGPNAGVGDDQYPPQSAQNQPLPGVSNFVDGSGPIFSMYLEMATEEDKKITENWKADADGILIFTGLFSAAVASLISVSIQDIQQNPQDTSNFYLANIYQATINPNGPNTSSSLPASPPPFSPPNHAVWVNSLWFLSLVISLTCALLATLLQQWARRYLKITQSRYSPHKRARIRAFFAEGVEKCLLPWAVEALPTLLHVSLFLFFAGLAVFLWNVNLTIFKSVLSWVGACTALYGCITLVPIFRHDSPYLTPLSLPAWHIVTGILFLTFEALRRLTLFDYFSSETYERFRRLAKGYGKLLVQGMQKTVEESALNSPPEIVTRAFLWTFDSLDEDHELERFFSGLPGFRSSKVVNDPLSSLTAVHKLKLREALTGLLDRTFSSDLLPTPVKNRRAMICAKALDLTHILEAFSTFDRILFRYQYSGPVATLIVQILRGWKHNVNHDANDAIMRAKATISTVVARVQPRDDSWFNLASSELGVPEAVLRDHATDGNSLSLAILIHITRQQVSLYRERYWPGEQFPTVLEVASKFNVLDTSPELQHKFCALWNQIVREMQSRGHPWMAFDTLARIRTVYAALHQDTDSAPTRFSASTSDKDVILKDPFSYPLCNIPGHHPDSMPHIHDVSASATIVRAVLHDNAEVVPASLAGTPDAPSPSVLAPVDVDEKPVDVPLLDNNITASFHPAHHTVTESLRNHATSPDRAAAGAARDIETSARTNPPTTPETSMPTPSVHPPGAVSLHNNHMAHSDAPDMPFSASLEPVFDGILPTAKTSPGSSLWPTSTPELGATTKDESSPKAGSRKDKDTLNLPSVNRAIQANATAILDLPPLLPPPLATHIANAGPSQQEPDAELTMDHPPTSRGQYDIV